MTSILDSEYYLMNVLEVHKVNQFLKFTRNNIKLVRYCPRCLNPNLSGYTSSAFVWCDTCHATYTEEELPSMLVDEYLKLLNLRPLKYNGSTTPPSLQEKQLLKDIKPRCYLDLTNEELDRFDDLIELNL